MIRRDQTLYTNVMHLWYGILIDSVVMTVFSIEIAIDNAVYVPIILC